jgi:hypothetical protein
MRWLTIITLEHLDEIGTRHDIPSFLYKRHRRQYKARLSPGPFVSPEVHQKKAVLSLPLAAPLMREEPNSDVGEGELVDCRSTTITRAGRWTQLASRRHLAGHRHHRGARPPLPDAATPCCHGCKPVGPPKPQEPETRTEMPSTAAEAPPPCGGRAPTHVAIEPPAAGNPPPYTARSRLGRASPPLAEEPPSGDRPRRHHPHPGFARQSLTAAVRSEGDAERFAGDAN